MKRKLMLALTALLLVTSCHEKSFDSQNPQASFAIAKEPYDDGNYEIALTKLGEYKTRFPYSHYAAEAELLIANAHFELGHYAEASAAYQQFIKLHPKNPSVPYAQYRIGESFWADAPEESDREQDLTSKAIKEWEALILAYPRSPYAAKAKDLIAKGKRRIGEAEEAVAAFYCKQKVWHACAYRYTALAENSPREFKDIIKRSLEKAAYAFDKLAHEQPANAKSDKNLYVRKFTPQEMRAKAQEFRQKAAALPQ